MDKLKFCRRIIANIAPYSSLLLALSGGLDSIVLLDMLTILRDSGEFLNSYNNHVMNLRAVYIHHGLSRYADFWAKHCSKECCDRNVKFSSICITLDDVKNGGIEATARSARYEALAKELNKHEVLLTAHHKDDQAETLMLALKRGSGPAGLSSMAFNSPFYRSRLIRPLLDFNKSEIKMYADKAYLRWVEDDSNKEIRFDRNFLRIKILHPLQQRWPCFSDAVARSAQLCAEQEHLLDELLKKTLSDLTHLDGSLYLMPLKFMSHIKRIAILRRWLFNYKIKTSSRQQLEIIWREVVLSRQDAIAQVKLDNNWQARRFRDRLYILPRFLPHSCNEFLLQWPRENDQLILPEGLGNIVRSLIRFDEIKNPTTIVRAPTINEVVLIRFRSVRGLLYILGRTRGRILKKIWQELNIPPWYRDFIPLVFYNKQLIAALGVFVTKEGAPKNMENSWHLFWHLNTDFIKNISFFLKNIPLEFSLKKEKH